jgi:hypothetical protein
LRDFSKKALLLQKILCCYCCLPVQLKKKVRKHPQMLFFQETTNLHSAYFSTKRNTAVNKICGQVNAGKIVVFLEK